MADRMFRRFFNKVVVALWLTLAVNLAWADDYLDRLHAAVVAASAPTLAQLHAELGEKPVSEKAEDVYLWAYTGWRLAQRLPEGEKRRRKRLLKDIQGELEDLVQRQPGDAEAMALLGGVVGDRIDGALSGMRLGGRASKMLDRAVELAPQNPRAALQQGVGYSFTPKAFGGGAEKAEQGLRRALELFAAEPADKAWPNWGRLDVLAWLGKMLADLDRPEEAREFYLRALNEAPDFVWVRDELLPALEATGS